jgi:hypothetical protein
MQNIGIVCPVEAAPYVTQVYVQSTQPFLSCVAYRACACVCV